MMAHILNSFSWHLRGRVSKWSCLILINVSQCLVYLLHSTLGCSALYCGMQFKFDIGRLLDARFDYCNLVWNNYLFNVSAEMLANVSVLKDFLLFRDKPEICSNLFNMDDITCFITGLCTSWLSESFCHWILFLFLFCVCMCVLFLVPCVRFNNK